MFFSYLCIQVASGLVDGASTMDIDRELAESAAYFACSHPDYSLLAGRLAVTSLHKSTAEDFGRVAELLYEYRDSRTNRHTPLLDEPLYLFIQEHRNEINSVRRSWGFGAFVNMCSRSYCHKRRLDDSLSLLLLLFVFDTCA